jgi:thioredoxin 1
MSNQWPSVALTVTDGTFESQVVEARLPVLVDVWATWCQPCRRVAPIVEEIAGEYAGRLVVAKVDADANPATVTRMGVVSIPTLALYRDGALVTTLIGAQPKPAIVAAVEEALA